MDQGTKSLLNVLLSVLAPVLILENCSSDGPSFWEIGTAWAMGVALSLPIACGIYSYAKDRKLDTLTLVGLLGTLLTGIVTIYANTGDGTSIRPDTPWWYAAKEALIALILACAILATARSERSMLRTFIYSDSLFNIPAIEAGINHLHKKDEYNKLLLKANLTASASLFFSAAANFLLALYFLLPIPHMPESQQSIEYNYAVGKMTWWGYLIIGIPLLLTLMLLIRHMAKKLCQMSGLPEKQIYRKSPE